MKPGDLVKYDHPANPLVGLVKSAKDYSVKYLGNLVLVQWCGMQRQSTRGNVYLTSILKLAAASNEAR
jgi:hypothetical protein